jgi:hypothetical protein
MQNNISLKFLMHEARALLTRLDRVRAFSLSMPMVPAASITHEALIAVELFLRKGCSELRSMIHEYISWLQQSRSNSLSPVAAQQKLTIIRIRFNNILSQVDIFSDVLNQRSEHDTGVWLSGLDVASADALMIQGDYSFTPQVICYLDRGHGGAIRRAHTMLPGGKRNPVAVIRVPRERMIGSGIASSLVHEVGHQGSALLDLVPSIMPVLTGLSASGPRINPWLFYGRWIGEIISDFWSVAKLGIASTLGLIGVVSLPRAFVFRISLGAKHPFPYIRVKLSCALGNALYPHPQWALLAELWESLYPLNTLSDEKRRIISMLEAGIPGLVSLLVNHRPRSLGGRSFKEAFPVSERQPSQLQDSFDAWRLSPQKMYDAPPTMVFAVLGQAKFDGKLTPEKEGSILSELLKQWALKSTLDISAICAEIPKENVYALAT